MGLILPSWNVQGPAPGRKSEHILVSKARQKRVGEKAAGSGTRLSELNPSSALTSCVTQESYLTTLCLHSLFYKMMTLIASQFMLEVLLLELYKTCETASQNIKQDTNCYYWCVCVCVCVCVCAQLCPTL